MELASCTYAAVALLSILVGLQGVADAKCPSHQFDLAGQQCCSKCPPGLGVAGDCTVDNDTVCKQCQHGVTFSSHHSHVGSCRICSSCGDNSHIVQKCNITHDTACECNVGYYYSRDTERCEPCIACHRGHGATRACDSVHNTGCTACRDGSTYSNITSGTEGCRVCIRCRTNQVMLQRCTAGQDTLCVDVPPPLDANSYEDPEKSDITEKRESSSVDFIPLYCALLGAVVLGLLIYVIYKHYQRLKEKRAGKEPHEDVEYSKTSGGDSGVYVENEMLGRSYPSNTKIRDVPQLKKKELEKCLLASSSNSVDDWKGLAHELGFTEEKIDGLEAHGKNSSSNPLRSLIIEWSKSEHATVGVLVRSLRNIGRQDVAKLLQNDSSELRPLNEAPSIAVA